MRIASYTKTGNVTFTTANRAPHILLEALTGDFAGNLDHVSRVAKSGLDVYAHNVETVEALTPFVRDRRATFRQSLSVLKRAKEEGVRVTKTSMMLGVGETEEQLMQALKGEVLSPSPGGSFGKILLDIKLIFWARQTCGRLMSML